MEYEDFPDSRRPTTGINCKTEPEQLEQVVAGEDQRPLALDLLQTPQQELPETAALLDLAEYRLHRCHPQHVALPAPFRPQLTPHPIPGGQMTGYASSRRGRNHSAVAGLLRRDEGVHAQTIQVVNRLRRVVTGRGGYLPRHRAGVGDGFLNHDHGLLLVRRHIGGTGRHDHLMRVVHHRLTVVGLLEVLPSRCGHDARLGIGEVALGLVVGHPQVLTTFGLDLFGSRLRLGFQRRHGLPYLVQTTLSKSQLLRQLISTLVFAVPPVFLIIRCLGLSQQLHDLRPNDPVD